MFGAREGCSKEGGGSEVKVDVEGGGHVRVCMSWASRKCTCAWVSRRLACACRRISKHTRRSRRHARGVEGARSVEHMRMSVNVVGEDMGEATSKQGRKASAKERWLSVEITYLTEWRSVLRVACSQSGRVEGTLKESAR